MGKELPTQAAFSHGALLAAAFPHDAHTSLLLPVLGTVAALLQPATALGRHPRHGVRRRQLHQRRQQGHASAPAVTLGGLIGFEFDAARIWLGGLDDIDVVDVDANVTTYMGNVVVRLPTGPFQPYGSAGVGVVRVTGNLDVPFFGDSRAPRTGRRLEHRRRRLPVPPAELRPPRRRPPLPDRRVCCGRTSPTSTTCRCRTQLLARTRRG